ncbi:MAG: FG-GAP-like repeat-containing protein [candidate division Zixibacteria bacterium]|nr:FG-GAP-like repeat-containing protein [candidate division Zixibacteria bacterium]
MKKLLIISSAALLFGFSLTAAQTPDAPYRIQAAGTPYNVTSADLNNDRRPDLVVVSYSGDVVYTMLGDGNGGFGAANVVGIGGLSADSVAMIDAACADFNGDGNTDVIVASYGTIEFLFYSGNGDGTLTLEFGFNLDAPAISVVTGNFDFLSGPNLNADFALLLNTSSPTEDSVRYWFGNGSGGFSTGTTSDRISTGGKGAIFMAKQTDPATGLEHVAVANYSAGNIGIIVSDGNGNFQPPVTIPTRPGYGIAWDLLNNDNLLDLAYTGIDSDSLFVRTGTGLTTYNAEVSYPTSPTPLGLCSGDFTGDGFVDLAAGPFFTDSVNFFINNGTGGFGTRVDAQTNIYGWGLTAADINRNGAPDLLIGSFSGDSIGIFNLQSPSVTPASIPGNPATGATLPLPAITAVDSTNIASVKLVYRQMGKTTFDTLTLTPGAGTPTQRDFTGTLPATALTNRGLEYFYRTSDGFVTASVDPITNIPPFRRLSTTITQNAPATFDRAYQLVSFPMRFSPTSNGSASIQIADDFSLTDSNVARLFWWDPVLADTSPNPSNLNGYREFPFPGLTNFYFQPGRSMFLATVGSKVYDAAGLSTLPNITFLRETSPGDSVLTDYYLALVTIDPGWNMIATPFPYTVDLDSVVAYVPLVDFNLHFKGDPIRDNRIGTGSLNLRERTASGYQVPNPPLLKPWRGYFLKNNGPEQVFLLYPKLDGNFPLTAPPAPTALAAGLAWKIDIAAKSSEIVTPPTTLGTSKSALREYDRLDWELPPPMPGDLRVVFQRGKEFGIAGDYLSDIRPTLTESETWTFTVEPGETRAIELNFDGLADVPAEYDVILADVEGRAKQNLRLEPAYRFIASKDRHFELTVAPKTAGQVALLPTKYDLHQNLPNPFNPQTLIKYDLPEAANVRLEVFNLLGQKVATLVNRYEAAGSKSVVWDGTDERGAKVSSGVYFYKLVAGDYVATKKMMLVK